MMITIDVKTGDPEEQCGGQHPDGGSQTILPTGKSLLCQVRCNHGIVIVLMLCHHPQSTNQSPFDHSSYLLRTLLEFLVALLLSAWLAVYGFIIEASVLLLLLLLLILLLLLLPLLLLLTLQPT